MITPLARMALLPRRVLINGLYTVANCCCLLADALSPTADDIWRDRRWRQWDRQRKS